MSNERIETVIYKSKLKISKIIENLINLFNGACVVLPFGMAVVFATVYIFGGWETLIPGHDLSYYHLQPVNHIFTTLLLLVIIVCAIYFVMFILSRVNYSWIRNKHISCMVTSVVIFFIAWCIRTFFICVFAEDIRPFSDFWRVWCIANGDVADHIDYYTLFPSYMNFAVFERSLIEVFNCEFIDLIYLNGILASATAVLLYLIGRIIFNNEKISIAIGLLYTFMPSNIVYCACATPEFLVIALNSIGVLCLLCALGRKGHRQIIFVIIGGVFVGAGSAYKSFGVIIIIAFLMAFFAQTLIELSVMWEGVGDKHVRNRILLCMLAVVLALCGYKFSTFCILNNTENVLEMELDSSISLPHFFLIGLNTEGEGQIGIGTLSRLYYSEYLNNGHDAQAAKQYALNILAEDWRNNTDSILPNFLRKMIWAFQDDATPLRYYNTRVGIDPDTALENLVFKFTSGYMVSLGQLYYWLLMIFATVACIFAVIHKKICYKREFLMLIGFGYFCLMILSEGQSRYKCLIMPYVCVLSAMGFYELVNHIKARSI